MSCCDMLDNRSNKFLNDYWFLYLSFQRCGGVGRDNAQPPHHTSCEVWWYLVVLKIFHFLEGNGAFTKLDTQFLVHFWGIVLNFWSIFGV
jgi:hypothetical protein